MTSRCRQARPAYPVILALLILVAGHGAPRAQGTPPVLKADHDFELVLIHDVGSRATVWDEVTPFLIGTFDVHAFELAGHGSTQPIAEPSIEKEAARLDDFLADNDIEYPTLVGHGIGGMIALRYTLDHPSRVYRLILIDTAPKQLATPEQKKQLIDLLAGDYGQTVAERALNMSPNPVIADQLVDTALRTDSASFIGLLLSTMDLDMTPELDTLSVPLLVVGSEMMFPASENSQAILYAVGFGHARSLSFKRIVGAGHFVMLEQPIQTASVLLAFGVSNDYRFDPDAQPPGDHEGHDH